MDRRTLLAGATGVGLLSLLGCGSDRPAAKPTPPTTQPTGEPSADGPINPQVAGEIATGLVVPWGIVFRPDATALVSERDTARILAIGSDGAVRTLGMVSGVDTDRSGEGGLLGLALDPDDPDVLYAYFTTAGDNRVARFSIAGDTLGPPEPVLTGIARVTSHHGGQLLFDDEGHLLVAVGDAQARDEAQNPDSLLGKILRITKEGQPAPGNPGGTAVWTYGHRNVQGLAFDSAGRLWSSEFGDKTADELNLITAGGNYGWPLNEGSGGPPGQVAPKVTWPTEECSPSGLAITRSTAFLGALRGQSLYAVPLDGEEVGDPQRLFAGEFGRIRSVVVAHDDSVWISTSNRDGRIDARDGDDRILRITL